ncbi:DUF4396 domain-containing protein [Odoribacter laneus]|uniref:DUF4396 domain-containing protein n=1 Tax=Odoribacter laneus TaxID=626933 RepID=UPI00189B890F|nr:DUF4396 domain-containing protein [Odoribacter laneus]
MTFFRFISLFFVISGIIVALLLYIDIRKHRQSMKIMEAVWPLSGLWGSWLALWAYYRLGRTKPTEPMHMDMNMNMDMPKHSNTSSMQMPGSTPPDWRQVTLSTLHCGAGCTLADILGEWFTYLIPLFIGGSILAGQWALDYILALFFGIFFQYAAIQAMEHLPVKRALQKALKADFLSLTAWQAGMYGWMAIVMFGLFPNLALPKNSFEYWFMMQIAMCAGFLTSFPVNRFLIRKGIKHGM